MSFGFFRTIWVSIRAVNYTTNAFRQVNKGLSELRQRQLMLGKSLLQMGFIYMAMGGIVIQTLMGIMTKSRQGERVMMRFSRRMDKSLKSLGNSLVKILEPILNVVATLLEIATANPIIRDLIAYIGLGIAVFLTFAGVINIVKGALAILGVSFAVLTGKAAGTQMVFNSLGVAVPPLTGKFHGLSIAIGMVVAGFSAGIAIAMTAYHIFGRLGGILAGLIAVIIGVAIALVALRAAGGDITGLVQFGAALAIGGAAGAAFVASQPEYAMGTSFVRRTGLAKVHRGERIQSARESGVTPRMDRTFASTYSKVYSPTTLHIHGDVYTRSSRETMVPAIKRALREDLDNKV